MFLRWLLFSLMLATHLHAHNFTLSEWLESYATFFCQRSSIPHIINRCNQYATMRRTHEQLANPNAWINQHIPPAIAHYCGENKLQECVEPSQYATHNTLHYADNLIYDGQTNKDNKAPFITQVIVPTDTTLFIVGNLFGNIKALSRILNKLRADQLLDNAWKMHDKIQLCFFGNYVNYGPASLAVWCTLMQLAINNPNQVMLLRGQAELYKHWHRVGKEYLLQEINAYYPYEKNSRHHHKNVERNALIAAFTHFTELLPYAIVCHTEISPNAPMVLMSAPANYAAALPADLSLPSEKITHVPIGTQHINYLYDNLSLSSDIHNASQTIVGLCVHATLRNTNRPTYDSQSTYYPLPLMLEPEVLEVYHNTDEWRIYHHTYYKKQY